MSRARWEHTHRYFPMDATVDDRMNALGREGWQLVSVVNCHLGFTYFFRRPAPTVTFKDTAAPAVYSNPLNGAA